MPEAQAHYLLDLHQKVFLDIFSQKSLETSFDKDKISHVTWF